jgi:hypothetical protein
MYNKPGFKEARVNNWERAKDWPNCKLSMQLTPFRSSLAGSWLGKTGKWKMMGMLPNCKRTHGGPRPTV